MSVVVPTRNEEENIALLSARLAQQLDASFAWELVVVDDSTDATPERVEQLREFGLPVRLHHRRPDERKGGLGGAVLDGFALAQGDVIVVMDADLQHPPERVPLLAEIVAHGGVDVAIGSRFAAGGAATGLDGPWRIACSQGLRWATRLSIPRVRAIRDPLSGFFAVRREVVEHGPVRSDGFKILLDVLVEGRWSEAIEVPYAFGARLRGSSKASFAEGVAFFRQLARARLRCGPARPSAARQARAWPRPTTHRLPLRARSGRRALSPALGGD